MRDTLVAALSSDPRLKRRDAAVRDAANETHGLSLELRHCCPVILGEPFSAPLFRKRRVAVKVPSICCMIRILQPTILGGAR
jgi:hypothetical protein